MSATEEKLKIVKNAIAGFPDFPKPGILFRDVFSVLIQPSTFKILHELLVDHVAKITPKVQAIAALESRGFLFGPTLALELEVPFIPIRKKGKLPGKVHSITYDLEYGQDTLEVQENSLIAGTKVLIIDDLIATGGSMSAACQLLSEIKLDIIQCLCIIELEDLKGRENVPYPVHSFIKY